MDPIMKRILETFPDFVDIHMVRGTSVIEYSFRADRGTTDGELVYKELHIPMKVVFDGVWAGMSPTSHTLYVYVEDQ